MPEIPERCRPHDPHLSALIDAELEASLADGVRAHVEGCERCSRRVAALRDVDSLLAQAPTREVPSGLRRRLDDRIAPQASPRRRVAAPGGSRRWFARPAIGVAIAAAAALALYLVLPERQTALPVPPEPRLAGGRAPESAVRPGPALAVKGLEPEREPTPMSPPDPVLPIESPRLEVARREPTPALTPEIDLDAVSEEDLGLLLELETLEDLEMIANLDLLERLLALEEGAG